MAKPQFLYGKVPDDILKLLCVCVRVCVCVCVCLSVCLSVCLRLSLYVSLSQT